MRVRMQKPKALDTLELELQVVDVLPDVHAGNKSSVHL